MDASHRLRSFLRAGYGISLGPDKEYLLQSRLTPVLETHGLSDFKTLATKIELEPGSKLAADVVSALTTNETSWFRDTRPFETLRTVVLPELLQQKAKSRSLRIWSAACSTGQEVYSIAMILEEMAAQLAGWSISIIGSDIAGLAIERAVAGFYSTFEIERGLSVERRERFFRNVGNGWQLENAIRRYASFQFINLLDIPDAMKEFDIIFCRNVLIYFDEEIRRRVLVRLASALHGEGYVFLGSTEIYRGVSDALKPAGSSGLYVKKKADQLTALA